MSNKNKPRLSLRGDQNVPTTELIAQPAAEPNAPIQEKTMEAVQEKNPEPAPDQSGLTAKQMAAAEEINSLRAKQLADQANQEPPAPMVPIAEVAARGYEALQEAFKRHNENREKKKEYIPPPRTLRQMSQLEEELEAGRRSQQRAEAQKLASQPAPTDLNKEGFTTPVYRPGDVVPDPTIPARGGSVAGTRQFGTDAP
jgi:hypothetical protein